MANRFSFIRPVTGILSSVLLVFLPLVALKVAILPLLGVERGGPPTEAISTHPVSFIVNFVGTIALLAVMYWLSARYIQKRAADDLRFEPVKMIVGAVSGVVLILLPMLVLYGLGAYQLVGSNGFSAGALAIIGVILMVVFLEEVIFRGIVLTYLEQHTGVLNAVLIQAAIFSLVHLINPNWSGFLPILSGFVIGCLWGALYVWLRNIWAVTLHHACWNITIFMTGLSLSGDEEWRPFALWQSDGNGSALLTGGVSGPEVSVLTIVFTSVTFVVLMAYIRRLDRQSPTTGPGPSAVEG